MSILVLLLSMISFAFGSPVYKESIKRHPQIEACASGGCYQEQLPQRH